MTQGYPEAPGPDGVAPEHSKAAQAAVNRKKSSDLSNAEVVPMNSKFAGLTLKNGRYLITKGVFKGKTAFRCPECSRGLGKSGEKLVCGEHGVISNPIDLRDVGKDKATTEWALKQYKIFLEEAKEEGFDTVKSYADSLTRKEATYAQYVKLGVGLEEFFKSKQVPAKIFTYETVEEVKDQLREELDFPFVTVQSSTLGGKENVSIIIRVSKDPEEEWANKIFENSRYAIIHVMNDGKTEQFSGWQLKMRKFKGKSIDHIIEKINKIKVVE